MPRIHRTAIVEDGAQLAPDVVVGAYALVGSQVRLDSGCVVGNHVVIQGRTTVGTDCHFHPGAVIGGIPQDLKYRGEPAELIIGNHNVFREHCTVNIGTETGAMVTRIGDGNLFMAGVHVAHDCMIGNGVILANLATLGGHVVLEDGARISGLAAIHQFVRIGRQAFVQGLAGVVQDVPPYMIAAGVPARVRAMNLEGLKRAGTPREAIGALKEVFRLLYRSDLNRGQAIDEIERSDSVDLPQIRVIMEFLQRSEQGWLGRTEDTRHRSQPAGDKKQKDEEPAPKHEPAEAQD